jgi:hypothetical protein
MVVPELGGEQRPEVFAGRPDGPIGELVPSPVTQLMSLGSGS